MMSSGLLVKAGFIRPKINSFQWTQNDQGEVNQCEVLS